MLKITAQISKDSYKEKPRGREVGKLKLMRNQLAESEYSFEELLSLVSSGHSFHPGKYKLSGNRPIYKESFREETFEATNLIVVDIDNGNKTIQEILERSYEFIPSAIYSTYSYTEENKRYRVIYIMDKYLNREETIKVKTFLTKRVGGDEACMKSAAFMYFGGKSILFKQLNIIDAEEILSLPEVDNIEVKPIVEIGRKHSKQRTGGSTGNVCISSSYEILRNIENLCIHAFPEKLNVSETFGFINSMDLPQILGVEENKVFRCILPNHPDNNPSANILYSSGRYVYKCFSPNCVGNTAINIVDVLAMVLDLTVLQVADAVCKVRKIEITSPYKEHVIDVCKQNEEIIEELYFSRSFNNKSGDKLMKTYRYFMSYVIENTTPYIVDSQDKKILITASFRHLSDYFKSVGYEGDLSRRLNRLVSLGLLHKMSLDELPESKRIQIEKLQRLTGYLKHITVWEIPELNDAIIEDAIKREEKRKEEGYTLQGMGRIEVANFIGIEEAAKIYTQEKIELKPGIIFVIRKIMRSKINERGWFMISEILQELPEDTVKNRMYKKYINRARLDEGLKASLLNAELRKQYSIPMEIRSKTKIYY